MSLYPQDTYIVGELVRRARDNFRSDMKQIKRKGIKNVVDYLEDKSDFFTAPASTQYHLHCECGLLVHSYHVTRYLKELVNIEGVSFINRKIPLESIVICGWFHDICKTNVYEEYEKWRKDDSTKKWENYGSYKFNDDLPLGHGEKSVFLLTKLGLELEDAEIAAINYHMGAFHFAGKFDRESSMQSAYERWPISLLLHVSDCMAAKIADIAAEKIV